MDTIHKKNGRLHIYVRQDKYKGELKSHNWVGRTYIDGKQKIFSSSTTDLEKATPILEKWFDDLHSKKKQSKDIHKTENNVPQKDENIAQKEDIISQKDTVILKPPFHSKLIGFMRFLTLFGEFQMNIKFSEYIVFLFPQINLEVAKVLI